MVFKKMLSALGVGGPSVDTVLSNPNTRPGLTLDGQVNIVGGNTAVDIEQVALGLVTRVEVEGHDSDYDAVLEFHRVVVAGAFRLEPGERRELPVSVPVPWETPVTDVYGQHLRGMTMGLRTELAVARAVDKGDLDPVFVHPLPAQERILEAFARLGFHFKNADLERGYIRGINQQLPFYQEIEYYPPAQYAGTVNEVELTFVANPQGMDVILEFDKRGGFFTGGHDSYGRFHVDHASADSTDWPAVVDAWIRQALGGYATLRGGLGGGPGHGPGYGKGPHHGRGAGMGGVAAGAAGGLLGGMFLGEALDNAIEGGDDFGGDFGGEE